PFTVPQDEALSETIMIGRHFLEMFPGTSNFFRAKYILEQGQSTNAAGAVIDTKYNPMEGLMSLAEYSTTDEVRYYASHDISYRNSSQPYDDVRQLVT